MQITRNFGGRHQGLPLSGMQAGAIYPRKAQHAAPRGKRHQLWVLKINLMFLRAFYGNNCSRYKVM